MLSPELTDYLTKWFNTSCAKQVAKGVIVNLTYSDFIELLTPRRAKSLQKAIDQGRLTGQQHEENPYAYVLTWISYAARSTYVFDKATACVCTRMESRSRNLMKQGDTMRPEHRDNLSRALTERTFSDEHRDSLSASLTGLAKTDEHRRAISESMKAVPPREWTQEQKDKMVATRAANKARKEAGL